MATERERPAQAAVCFVSTLDLVPDDTQRVWSNQVRFTWWSRNISTVERAVPKPRARPCCCADGWQLHASEQYLLIERTDTGWELRDLEGEKQLALPELDRHATCCARSPDGRFLAIATDSGRCQLLQVPA